MKSDRVMLPGIGRQARLELQIVNGFVGDRGGNDGTIDLNLDMRRRLPLGHGFDSSLDLVARAQFHDAIP